MTQSLKIHDDRANRYQWYRKIGKDLHISLVKQIDPLDYIKSAQRLGIGQGKRIFIQAKCELDILLDYCLYDIYHDGRNALQRLLAESKRPAGSDERRVLESAAAARYCLFIIEDTDDDGMVYGFDLLRGEPAVVVDFGLSQSAPPGFVLATRLTNIDDFSMTTGVSLPVHEGSMVCLVEKFTRRKLTKWVDVKAAFADPLQSAKLTGMILRTCLANGESEHISFIGATKPQLRDRSGTVRWLDRKNIHPSFSRVGRNDPCPCGSGKKFKKCCAGKV